MNKNYNKSSSRPILHKSIVTNKNSINKKNTKKDINIKAINEVIIKKIDKNLIPKIAAGEVVDRPASALKELIDNSLDAKATKIIIQIKNGGSDLIKVIDNGFGMSKKDLLNCYLPFTTSKIFTEQDLNNITSFGFRGEALNSISSVCKISIKSRVKNSDHGYQLNIEGGDFKNIKPIGMDFGTVISISDLFYNVPARKKFLKSPTSEIKFILKMVENFALSNKNVSFKLINNSKQLINVLATNSIENRIFDVLNINKNGLFKLKAKSEHFLVWGFIGNPNLSSYIKNNYIFVNNRYVENRQISKSVKSAYGTLLEHSANPFSILFIDLMPSLVNVNIHPQKKEVSFYDDKKVFDVIHSSVKNVLQNKLVNYNTDYFGKSLKKASSYQFKKLKFDNYAWNVKGIEQKISYEDAFQIDDTYIVTQTNKGLILIDQHAAHESILYEQFMDSYLNSNLQLELFNCNLLLDLSSSVKFLVLQNIDLFKSIGFDISDFGDKSIKVNYIPKIFKDHDVYKLIEQLLQQIEEKGEFDKNFVDQKTQQTIAFLACRSAIKANEVLTKQEMINLAKKLDESKGYLTCPHGRPTKILLSTKDLEKIFKRI